MCIKFLENIISCTIMNVEFKLPEFNAYDAAIFSKFFFCCCCNYLDIFGLLSSLTLLVGVGLLLPCCILNVCNNKGEKTIKIQAIFYTYEFVKNVLTF